MILLKTVKRKRGTGPLVIKTESVTPLLGRFTKTFGNTLLAYYRQYMRSSTPLGPTHPKFTLPGFCFCCL